MRRTKFDLTVPKQGEPIKADLIAALVDAARSSGIPTSRETFEEQTDVTNRGPKKLRHDWWYAKAESGTIPRYSAVTVVDAETDDEGQLTLIVKAWDEDDSSLIFAFNHDYEVDSDDGGHVRLAEDGGPFLAKIHDDAWGSIAFGLEVGVDDGSVELSDDVDGPKSFVVLSSAEGYGTHIAYVIAKDELPAISHFKFGSHGDLVERGDSVGAFPILIDAITTCGEQPFIFGAGVEVDICPNMGWRGVAFGGIDDPFLTCDQGDVIAAVKLGEIWYAIGCGHLTLPATADADIVEGECGSFTAHAPCGGDPSDDDLLAGTCDTPVYRDRTVTARAQDGDIDIGDEVVIHWTGKYWIAKKGSGIVELGCGLKLDDDDAITLDFDELLGCGLTAGDGACDIKVDNTALAGENLEAGDNCSLNVAQALIDRIDVIEGRLDGIDLSIASINNTLIEMGNILIDFEQRIIELEECCEEVRQDIYECCYGAEDIEVAYDVYCDGSELGVKKRCIQAKPC